MMLILRVSAFVAGLLVVIWTLLSAVKTFVLPRSAPDQLTRMVFVNMRRLFGLRLRKARTYRERDQVMAYYTPLSLLALVPAWYTFILLGYTLMYWALGSPWYSAFRFSGSSLLTLGITAGDEMLAFLLEFSEAAIGLILIALLIAYLPTIYTAFSRRETAVTLLEVRAGNPPSAVELLERFNRIHGLNSLNEVWRNWETWFAEIEESHTSLPALVFLRSPQPEHSWVTAAGAVLDAASLTRSSVDVPNDPMADLCIRAGYLALRHISDFFNISYNPNPHFPADSISIPRAEYEAACERLAASGVPLKPDRDAAWQAFAGWRVNYDTVLLALVRLTMAPESPWTGARAEQLYLPPVLYWSKHSRNLD